MNSAEKTAWIAAQARALGMDLCGVAPLADFPELANLGEWLARGYAGEMQYLHDKRRRSPAMALHRAGETDAPEGGSIIVCAMNYNTAHPYSTEGVGAQHTAPDSAPRGWISRYAWGDDYHDVLGDKLAQLLAAVRQEFGDNFAARAYVDTGPVVERVAAKHAGLGWLAKNTCLINEQLGSWLFLGVILTTLELAPSLAADEPPADLCGNCRLCIDACPTGAIVEPYVLDARRCISYLTIELRGPVPEEFRAPMGRMVFGCDICQDVCPWNRKAPATTAANFQPRIIDYRASKHSPLATASNATDHEPLPTDHRSLVAPDIEWLASLTEDEFRDVFRGSAVKRTKWRGLVRNACIALGNSNLSAASPGHTNAIELLNRLTQSTDTLIAEHAAWALERITKRRPA